MHVPAGLLYLVIRPKLAIRNTLLSASSFSKILGPFALLVATLASLIPLEDVELR